MYRNFRTAALAATLAIAAAGPARAVEDFRFFASGLPGEVRETLGEVSLLAAARRSGLTDPVELLATARAEYARLIEALYAEGYYGPVISVRVDGREAADIPPFERPARIGEIEVRVDAGPRFRFDRAVAGPLAEGTALPGGFAQGQIARTTVLVDTARTAVEGWRDAGHPKADVAGEELRVRHHDAEMDAEIFIDPGPRLRFGTLVIEGNDRVRTSAVGRIVGWPRGALVTPKEQQRAANRLRRSGAFRSVVLREAEEPNPDGTLDHTVVVVEERPRRFGFGGELSTEEGLRLSAFWLHRNLLGDAERLRFDAEVSGIGGGTGGVDTLLSARFERPATFFTDADFYVETSYEGLNEPDFSSDTFAFETGLERIVSDTLTVSGGLGYRIGSSTDATGSRDFQLLTLPVSATWSTRDNPLDAQSGYFLEVAGAPFLGFGDAGSGFGTTVDARAYRSLGDSGRLVLAARVQAGSILGARLEDVPSDMRFRSGGGGSVRGQPYQSLGVDLGGETTGGLSFAAVSAELRASLTESIGAVAFIDAGLVAETGTFGGQSGSHSGAGLGLRYDTGLGPIRFDIATPITESPGGSIFIYIGIGQAF